MKKTNAITRLRDGTVSAKLDDYGAEGLFRADGSVIRGTLGTLPQAEMAYFIWRQVQDVRLTEKKLREMWVAFAACVECHAVVSEYCEYGSRILCLKCDAAEHPEPPSA